MGYELKSTDISPRRRRTLKAAVQLLECHAKLSPERRRSALARIRRAAQPVAEARRIIRQSAKDSAMGRMDIGTEVDHSHVQALRVRLIHRDHGIWPPHADLLAKLDRRVATCGMTKEEFKSAVAMIYGMKPALDPRFRKAEQQFERE